MFVPFENMPKTSRVWIYQSNRNFSEDELQKLEHELQKFTATWKRHGEDLKSSFTIKYNQFVVLAVDESFRDISGCSIDASVHFMKQLENEFHLDLMNKMNISFKIGDVINTVAMPQFQQFVKDQKIDSTTTVFNNMVQNIEEFESKWEVPAAQSWHQRFLKTVNS